MRTSRLSLFISLIAAASAVVISSCKDEEPFVKPKLAFSTTAVTVNEADQTLSIELSIDKAFTENIRIDYILGGTAIDKTTASGAYDYEITSEYLESEIIKGQTTTTIEVKLYSDFGFEESETIEISIQDVNSENIEITRDDEITVTIEQEDGLIVVLEWGVGTGENYTDVDMDLFLWAENSSGDLALTSVGAASASYSSPEFFFIPTAPLEDGDYGLSCNYYEGSEDPMNFRITFIEVIDNNDAETTEILGTYTAANLNAWDVTNIDPLLVQTFEKVGTDWSNFSTVDVPSQYSRTTARPRPHDFLKKHGGVNLPPIQRPN